MKVIEPGVLFEENFELGEGPVWHAGRLWWVDINVGDLHAADQAGGGRVSYAVGGPLGAAVPTDHGRFVVALKDSLAMFDPVSGALATLASVEHAREGNRFNDGKCDPVGRFVVGSMSTNGERDTGSLYSFGTKGGLQTVFSPVSLSNGLAWSADGSTLYYIDTLAREVVSFDYDVATGGISNRRSVVQIPESMGMPDGMTIDAEGNLWIAFWGGAAVRCWSFAGSGWVAEVRMPCSSPTSCCFGGSDFRTLFITTAGAASTGGEDDSNPLAGCIFACEPGIVGRPMPPFATAH